MTKEKYQIDLYYDVFSPYSWIGFEGLLRYENIWPITVNLKPFCLRDIMIASGNKPPAMVMARGMYMLKDLARNNDFWGINIQPPAKFMSWLKNKNTTTELTQKALIALQKMEPEKLIPASRAFWKRMWTNGEPIFSETDILTVLRQVGVQNAELVVKRAQECPKIVEELNFNTQNAINEGAYGAPWIVVHKNGETHSFFGSDRFHLIGQLVGGLFTDGQQKYAAKL